MSAKINRCLSIAAFVLILIIPALFAEGPRYALVIGNGNYADFGKLANPVNDATDIAASLRDIGFKVVLLTDVNRRQMNLALNEFHDSLAQEPTSAGFFWYGGHGIQSKGENYLLPMGAQIKRETDLEDEAVSARKISTLLDDARNRVNLVVLDACRNNPIPSMGRGGTRGLTVVSAAPAESVIMYSTGAGQVASDGTGRNSPFAKAFLKYMAKAGDILATVKAVTAETKRLTNGSQVPYLYSSLTQDFALNPKAEAASPAPSPMAIAAPVAAASPAPTPVPASAPASAPTVSFAASYGGLTVVTSTPGALFLDGKKLCDLPANKKANIGNIETGDRSLELRYADGQSEKLVVAVAEGKTAPVSFVYGRGAKGYRIGDLGPAGGLVFYDKGKVTNGWRYLEAAPEDTSEGAVASPMAAYDQGGGAELITSNSGQENSIAIINYLGPGNYAAQLCRKLGIGGFSDWFLPSAEQLDLMYKNLKLAGLGGFAPARYWSSNFKATGASNLRQFSADVQSFSSGNRDSVSPVFKARVRAVRAFAGVAQAESPAPGESPDQSALKEYKIGDLGPAGGLVFYDKGKVSNGWRYLEAAPEDASDGVVASPMEVYNQGGGPELTTSSSGQENSIAIIKYLGQGDYAAQLCRKLAIGGFSNWFLPSAEQLDLMYKNLKMAGLGAFAPARYWSSNFNVVGASLRRQFSVYTQSFSSGKQDCVSPVFKARVRAVRAF